MADRPNEIRNLNRRLRRAANANVARHEALENRGVNRNNNSSSSEEASDSDRSSRSSIDSIGNNQLGNDFGNIQREDNDSEHNEIEDNEFENNIGMEGNEIENNQLGGNELENLQLENDVLLESDGSSSHQSGDESEHESEISEDPHQEHVLFLNDEDKERYLIFALRQWALEGGVLSMSKLDSLLAVLSLIFPNLPRSYKTLLKTPLNSNIVRENDGELSWYKGIATNLANMQLDEYLQKFQRITIDFNMDGLPLQRSGLKKFWPILGRLVNSLNCPFTIAIYQSDHDPRNVYTYLHDLVEELQYLLHNGFNFKDTVYPFVARNFILDRPARALVKCCVGHGAYGGCEKCEVFGEYVGDRMVYLELNAPLRTDQSYIQQTDRYHHIGRSPLETAGIGMVSSFRLDSFHLVYHGVFKRLLEVYNTWPGPWRFTIEKREEVSAVLASLVPSCPHDFNRKPRCIRFWKHYHGTEERRLLIYDGLLVFRDKLSFIAIRHLHFG